MSRLILTEFVRNPFKPTDTRTFGPGVAVHTYEPA